MLSALERVDFDGSWRHQVTGQPSDIWTSELSKMRIIESAQNNSETVQEQSKFVQKRSWSCEMDSSTKNTTLSEPRRLALVICVQSPWHRFIRVSDFKNVLMWKLENKHFSVSVTRSESFSWHIFERFEIHYILISFFTLDNRLQGWVK